MRVDVYNRNPSAEAFDHDASVLEGDTWDEVMEAFESSWYFEEGGLYVLVAQDNVLDPVRVVRAHLQAVTLEPVA